MSIAPISARTISPPIQPKSASAALAPSAPAASRPARDQEPIVVGSDRSAIISAGLDRMKALHERFKNDQPMPQPMASERVAKQAIEEYSKMKERLAPPEQPGFAIVA